MTTDRQKAELGVLALYTVFTNQPYWPRVHSSRQRAFKPDPLYLQPQVEFVPDQDLIKVNHDYVPDLLLNTWIE